jgi:hypothetical protein
MCRARTADRAALSPRYDFNKEETPAEGVRKVMYYDPDGNEIGIGRVPPE